MASITFYLPGKTFSIEGSEREIQQLAYSVDAGFEKRGGSWVSDGQWTAWIPATTPLKITLAGDELEGITALPVRVAPDAG